MALSLLPRDKELMRWDPRTTASDPLAAVRPCRDMSCRTAADLSRMSGSDPEWPFKE